MTSQDSSQRPYLVRAMHEWMTDTGKTPHLIIDAVAPGVQVPVEYVQDGKIVLNCSYSAIKNLVLGNDEVEFEARFGGVAHLIRAPIDSVLGIYARESGEGMLFSEQEVEAGQPPMLDTDNDDDSPEPPPAGPGRSHLRVVK
ncbi:MAG: ClpXP protease specificity-enhancing factor [Gammaproteobacteria bacterium]|nr:MAG: ClpXP protease specificity-enhancing factor [Gammaproteobacteria bacterium]